MQELIAAAALRDVPPIEHDLGRTMARARARVRVRVRVRARVRVRVGVRVRMRISVRVRVGVRILALTACSNSSWHAPRIATTSPAKRGKTCRAPSP